MSEAEVRRIASIVLEGVGRPQVQSWMARWVVHQWLGVDRWRYRDHWAIITRAWTSALYLWSAGDVAGAGSQLRRGVEVYDLWRAAAGVDGPDSLDLARELAARLGAEWARQRMVA